MRAAARVHRRATAQRRVVRSLGLAGCLLGLSLPASGETWRLELSPYQSGEVPGDFQNTLAGDGKPGQWEVLTLPESADPSSTDPSAGSFKVLAQRARDQTDEHFPLFIYEPLIFGDFTLRTRFRMVDGETEQMAGIAFRVQDEKNFYLCRASAKGDSFWFYKVVGGIRGRALTLNLPIAQDVWYDLEIEAKGHRINIRLNGKPAFPEIQDLSFVEGKIAFWTKSDSVSYFADTEIDYIPRKTLAEKLVAQTLERFQKLVGLDIFAATGGDGPLVIVASSDPARIGLPAGETEEDVLETGTIYYGKTKETTIVSRPLRNRNGDPIAVARIVLDRFPGQTKKNALSRTIPIAKRMEVYTMLTDDITQ